ncbi:kunitz-type U15-theraphotoxin-Hs1g-like [Drosophila innubila]|uniref:kunitz-type U15-theraphotoxin-Hs1g-like n=1 Tax=Drosophila innubila TaxID=198719 RepID=UPI00148C2B36|nr:kunitz-type U15-theraphotoxin-Hs1g-like [Drosophila innubila]
MLFILILILSIAYAQDFDGCAGCPDDQSCDGGKNIGHADLEGCSLNANNEMWYYSGNSCNKMKYLGCGGNRNRYCSKFHCVILCARIFDTKLSKW